MPRKKSPQPAAADASVHSLKRWAIQQLSEHVCRCDNCRSARTVLDSIKRNDAFGGCHVCGAVEGEGPNTKHLRH